MLIFVRDGAIFFPSREVEWGEGRQGSAPVINSNAETTMHHHAPIFWLHRLRLCGRKALAGYRRNRQIARHTRKLAALLREEPPYVAEALHLFFQDSLSITEVAARLDVPRDDVFDAFLRIIELFDEDVR